MGCIVINHPLTAKLGMSGLLDVSCLGDQVGIVGDGLSMIRDADQVPEACDSTGLDLSEQVVEAHEILSMTREVDSLSVARKLGLLPRLSFAVTTVSARSFSDVVTHFSNEGAAL